MTNQSEVLGISSYKQFLYSIYDKKMHTFAAPFLCPNSAVAQRSLMDFLRSPSAELYVNHPADFCLVEIGSFDTSTGKLSESADFQVEFIDLVSALRERTTGNPHQQPTEEKA